MKVAFCILTLLGSLSLLYAKPNVLLICIDDLNTHLPMYGHQHIHTPNMEKLANQGRLFSHHYVQAPTCGVSRFSLLFGKYPPMRADNGLIAKHHKKQNPSPSFPSWLKSKGYETIAIGKISHHPGGYLGKNWDDPTKPEMPGAWTRSLMPCGPWKTPVAAMHGYAGGKARVRGKNSPLETTTETPAYPDDLILEGAQKELNTLATSEKPWLLAVGFIKPHLPFTAPQTFLNHYKDITFPPIPSPTKPNTPSLWHGSWEFMGNYSNAKDPRKDAAYALEVRKYYAASTSYVDDNIGKLLTHLDKTGLSKNTTVILWSDHGFSLGEKAIWGKHHLYITALHAPLIIRTPNQKTAGQATSEIVETIDLYPTICELAGLPLPGHLDGQSLTKIIDDPKAKSDGTAISLWRKDKSIITKETHTIFRDAKPLLKFDLTKDPHEKNNLIK